ncbi:MAG: lamin tail domain-containing protein [Pseudomonadota bacterium]|nr:lamin tail domain-containing protein [Pseudomonadota bacterium]
MRASPRQFASLLALLSACAPSGTGGVTLYVQPAEDGEWDDERLAVTLSPFTTIQAAIDAASSGDTVAVPSGTYTEDLTLRSGVSVQGAGQGQTWVVGSATQTSGSVTISRLSMIDPDYVATGTRYLNYGVHATGGSITLEDVGLHYFLHGLRVESGANAVVSDSLLSYNWYGAVASGANAFTVFNSLIGSNSAGGLAVSGTSSTNIIYNTLVGNAFAGTATYLVGAISLSGTTDSSVHTVANNIVTSNYYGLDCHGCEAAWGGNLVWGNTTNYINDASTAPNDVNADPGFRNAGEGDYGLSAMSVCIDAAWGSHGVSNDADGEVRPQGAGYDIGMDEYANSAYSLLITEVVANARTESTGEFVEIYNAGGSTVDLAGFRLTDGDEVDTLQAFGTSGTTLAPGAYAVVVDPEYVSGYTIASGVTLLTTGDTEVGNGLTTSDRVTLYESDGSTVAAAFSSPRDPGDGISMEQYDLTVGDTAGNWRASQCSSGSSPGAQHCFPETGDPADLVLTEILANATDESTGEYVEIYNTGTQEIDAAGLVLRDATSSDTLQGFGGGSTLIGPGKHALIVDSAYTYNYWLPTDVVLLTTDDATLGNGLSTSDTVTLLDADGTTVIDTFSSPSDPGDGHSIEKIDYAAGDIATNWSSATSSCVRGASPGRLNGATGGECAVLLINEVMSNPLDEDTGEFIEIYNAGSDSVDLAGLVFTDGAQDDVIAAFGGGSTLLAPGGWALVVDAEYAGEYTLAASVVLVTTMDTTLGNGLAVGDEIELYEADGFHVIDAYVWPTNPGNGVSVERVSTYGTLDSAANWIGSTCASGSSPGASNCVSSGGSSATESSYDLVISEVMSNPLDESTGEFVEIYNAGSTDVDLLYMVIWDGDAVDTIFGYGDIYNTVLGPGEYAVILDSNYAGEYSIPGDALVLTADDSTIGSGLSTDDSFYLYESGGTALIDGYSFPTNPGNGTSVQKVDLAGGDTSSNWSASTCSSGSSPGSATCL